MAKRGLCTAVMLCGLYWRVHRPRIELGSHPWQGCILPLDQRCWNVRAGPSEWPAFRGRLQLFEGIYTRRDGHVTWHRTLLFGALLACGSRGTTHPVSRIDSVTAADVKHAGRNKGDGPGGRTSLMTKPRPPQDH